MIYDPEMRAYLHAAGWIEGRTDDVNRIRDEAHWDGMISHPNVPGRVFTLAVAAAIQQATWSSTAGRSLRTRPAFRGS